MTALFKTDQPIPQAVAERPARSEDTFLRQAATILLARKATEKHLKALCESADPRTRLAGVLAVGFRLTLPVATAPIGEQLPLQPWPNDDPYIVKYATKTVDLRQVGRLGVFILAEHWNAAARSAEQEALFAMLSTRLEDPVEPVRLQAAPPCPC